MTATWHWRLIWFRILACSRFTLYSVQLWVRLYWIFMHCPQINVLNMEFEKLYFFRLMLHEFWKRIILGTATKNIQKVYLNLTPALRTAKMWFVTFLQCDFNLTDQARCWRTSDAKEVVLFVTVKKNPRMLTEKIAKIWKSISQLSLVIWTGLGSRKMANRKGMLSCHDNARPHVAKELQKVKDLKDENLQHSRYSPGLTTLDLHLSQSRQNN